MKRYWPLLTLTPLVILLDQWTKHWILGHLPRGEEIVVIRDFFEIVHVRNRGAAFGFLSGWDSEYRLFFFYALSALAMGFIIYLYVKTTLSERLSRIALASILGGAIGNGIDRWIRGEVVDFLHFHWRQQSVAFDFFGKPVDFFLSWPAFNVADMAISCGTVALALSLILNSRAQHSRGLS